METITDSICQRIAEMHCLACREKISPQPDSNGWIDHDGNGWIDHVFRDYPDWDGAATAPKRLYVIYNAVQILLDGQEHIDFIVNKLRRRGDPNLVDLACSAWTDNGNGPTTEYLTRIVKWLELLTQEQMAVVGI